MARFRQKGGYIPWNKIDIWLQGFRSIWVSTTRPDGRPHCVPVWYWWNGEDIYFSTVSSRTDWVREDRGD